jgi:replication-associated recombination protein RarA
MYNAMTYSDLRSFALTLHADLLERFTGKEHQRLSRSSVDDDSISQLIVKAMSMDKTRKIVLVIDEVDQFNKNEKGFTCLIKAILQ